MTSLAIHSSVHLSWAGQAYNCITGIAIVLYNLSGIIQLYYRHYNCIIQFVRHIIVLQALQLYYTFCEAFIGIPDEARAGKMLYGIVKKVTLLVCSIVQRKYLNYHLSMPNIFFMTAMQ